MVETKNDLTGKKFGRLTVLKRVEDHVSPKGKCEPKWLCECECGQTKEIIGRSLIYGKTLSCGCLSRERASEICKSRIIDLVGMKFGYLTVISQHTDVSLPHKEIKWDCVCECGNECIASGNSLKSGQTITCGCRMGRPFDDLTGKRFGRLIVVEMAERSKWGIRWRCLCDCGNYCEVLSNNLKNGHAQSCGCYQKEVRDKYIDSCRIDIAGMKFGRLTAVEPIGKHIQPSGQTKTLWRCKCDCGSETLAQVCSLTSGQTQSCGCFIRSRGETKIFDFLTVKKIEFIEQKKFDGCKDKQYLPFDFYLPQHHMCIEYDGEQHFRPVDWGFHDEERMENNFSKVQKHDKIKDQYCRDNNITLIRIPYTEFDNIENILSQNLN